MRIEREFQSFDELITALQDNNGRQGGLKAHYIAHEEIAGAMKRSVQCVSRAGMLLDAIARAVATQHVGCERLAFDAARSIENCNVVRFLP